jgi:two-component system, chemotaxis family, CheB/CheR fusion protein
MTAVRDATLDDLLEFVKRTRGFDFTGYKRPSLERRLRKRMDEVGSESYTDYLDYLEVHQDEFAHLFNTILINVTAFFRDPPMWDHLRDEVVPALLAGRPDDAPVRAWVAGCASGEEAYSLAMVLASVMGESAYRDRAKIYATDVDEEALATARGAIYTPKQVEEVPRELLDRFFERSDTRYAFRPDLRRSVIFGRNDLVQDAPISRVDVLLCRNTLMYFNAEAQARILNRFNFALHEHGVLVLGKSEMLITHPDLFTPVDLKRRVFRKVLGPTLRERLHTVTAHPETVNAGDGMSASELAFEAGPGAQALVGADGVLVMANRTLRQLFGLSAGDVSKPLQDLELSYRPVELRGPLDEVRESQQPVSITGVQFGRAGDERLLDIQIAPLVARGEVVGASISYLDVTRSHALQEELETSKRDLENAYEELQSTVEELETTNEELQSTNEELETTNEELQSTNEELDTMNEELQATNEELETINDELRVRSIELDEVNAHLEAILGSIGAAVAVIDRAQVVRIWNRNAEDLWGLRADEAEGSHVLSLDIGLPVERLKQPIRDCLAGSKPRSDVSVEATNRRGRPIRVHVSCLPLTVPADDTITGAVILMEPHLDGAAPA